MWKWASAITWARSKPPGYKKARQGLRLGGLFIVLVGVGLWFFVWGHIRFFGCGGYWFRPYGESLWKSPKVTKGLLPLSFGASLRLGMPSLRSCSVGPPPSAIHGRGRLTRHPCRVAHCAGPPLGLSRGRPPPQPPRRPESRPGSLVVRTLPHGGVRTNFGCLHIPL
ncbi:hypothetical protein EMIT0P44_110157 [Pseudomonas sp. IT-P44]